MSRSKPPLDEILLTISSRKKLIEDLEIQQSRNTAHRVLVRRDADQEKGDVSSRGIERYEQSR
jgi:hypothetical protein